MNCSDLFESCNISEIDMISSTTPVAGADHSTGFYVTSTVLSLIAILVVIVSSTMVIITIAYKMDLHKCHYWFIVNLLMCDVISALTFAPLCIILYLPKFLKLVQTMIGYSWIFTIFYIAPVCSGFMIVNSTIDTALAILFPLEYESIMSKTKAFIMVAAAWILSVSVTLALVGGSEYDVSGAESLYSCTYSVSAFATLPVVKIFITFVIIGLNLYLYWSVREAKWKLKTLVLDSNSSNSKVKHIRILIKKYKSITYLSIALLLIIVIDGVLRMFRLALVLMATSYGFSDHGVYLVLFLITSWADYINRPVVYGIMLCKIDQGIL